MPPSREDLPNSVALDYGPWPEIPPGGDLMEFRLVYDGKLPSAGRHDVEEKHRIRRALSPQLEMLRNVHPRLIQDRLHSIPGGAAGFAMDVDKLRVVHPLLSSGVLTIKGRAFTPLITGQRDIGCALDILFLRRDQPGGLVTHYGDIDNRIKVLFDALRMPREDKEVSDKFTDDPQPFHCLLDDDRLITDIRITTDRLLVPKGDNESESDVRLIIHVRTIGLDPGNLLGLTF